MLIFVAAKICLLIFQASIMMCIGGLEIDSSLGGGITRGISILLVHPKARAVLLQLL